jgi:hypothetical protein
MSLRTPKNLWRTIPSGFRSDDPKLFNDPLCHAAADAYHQRFFDRLSIEPKSIAPDAAAAEASVKALPDPKFAAPKF